MTKSLTPQQQTQTLQERKSKLKARLELTQKLSNSDKSILRNHKLTNKFRDLPADYCFELATRINDLAAEFGVKTETEMPVCMKISKSLIEGFKDFSIEELFESANMYNLQQLDFKDSHFQDFSLSFISKVLISYRKERNKALTALIKEEERLKRLEEEKADDERRKNLIKPEIKLTVHDVKKAYRKAEEKNKPVDVFESSAVIFFRMMLHSGVYILSKEVSQQYRVKGYESLKKSFTMNEKLDLAFDKMQRSKTTYDPKEKEHQNNIRNRAAKILVDEWLTEKLKTNISIDDLLKE